jgi:hypothetical protein
MAKHKDNLCKLHRHTQAIHATLVGYLDSWIPILGSWADRLVLIDVGASAL